MMFQHHQIESFNQKTTQNRRESCVTRSFSECNRLGYGDLESCNTAVRVQELERLRAAATAGLPLDQAEATVGSSGCSSLLVACGIRAICEIEMNLSK